MSKPGQIMLKSEVPQSYFPMKVKYASNPSEIIIVNTSADLRNGDPFVVVENRTK